MSLGRELSQCSAADMRRSALVRSPPIAWKGTDTWGESLCNGSSTPCVSLNNSLCFCGCLGFFLEAFPVAVYLLPISSGCLLIVDGSLLPGFAHQFPYSSSQPSCTPVDTCPGLGHAGLWHGKHMFRFYSVLSATD